MKSVLSIDPNTVTAKAGDSQPDLKPVTIPLQVKPKIEEISPEKLNELHKQEDVVLEKNNLPKPTSEKYVEINIYFLYNFPNKK